MTIEYASVEKYKSFSEAVNSVCREGVYLSSTTGFVGEYAKTFVEIITLNNYAQYFAVEGNRVLGWCDILPKEQDLHKHVGVLGMGVIAGFRHKGIGARLLTSTLAHAKSCGIERVELEVYAGNINAQKLYEKFGFENEGVKRNGKKSPDGYEDVIIMGLI